MLQMKNLIKKIKSIVSNHTLGVIFGLWLFAFVFPLVFTPKNPDKDKKDKLDYYGISLLAASALFTGIAFSVTYASLEHQKKSLQEQTELLKEQVIVNLFTTTSKTLEHSKFLEGKRYISSSNFYEDVKKVKYLSGKEDVSLHDFKICLMNRDNSIDSETIKRLSNSYNLILHFCQKMEYMGYLHENMSLSILINYYGRTIKTTYKALQPLIEVVTETGENDTLFIHYSALYYAVLKAEPQYLINRKKMIQSFTKE